MTDPLKAPSPVAATAKVKKPKTPKAPKPPKPAIKVIEWAKQSEPFKTWWQKPVGKIPPASKEFYEVLDDETKALFQRMFEYERDHQSLYTATLTVDAAKELGKPTHTTTQSTDEDALKAINTVVGLWSVEKLSAKLISSGASRVVELPPEEPEDPFDDAFYEGEDAND
jgi:hypothetical protein